MRGAIYSLVKLITSSLYESLGLASIEMKTITNKERLLISSPIWLLKLWLNAIFESFLNVFAPSDLAIRVEGTILVLLTP